MSTISFNLSEFLFYLPMLEKIVYTIILASCILIYLWKKDKIINWIDKKSKKYSKSWKTYIENRKKLTDLETEEEKNTLKRKLSNYMSYLIIWVVVGFFVLFIYVGLYRLGFYYQLILNVFIFVSPIMFLCISVENINVSRYKKLRERYIQKYNEEPELSVWDFIF